MSHKARVASFPKENPRNVSGRRNNAAAAGKRLLSIRYLWSALPYFFLLSTPPLSLSPRPPKTRGGKNPSRFETRPARECGATPAPRSPQAPFSRDQGAMVGRGERRRGRLSGVVGSFITAAIPIRPRRQRPTHRVESGTLGVLVQHAGLRRPEISKYLVSVLPTTCSSGFHEGELRSRIVRGEIADKPRDTSGFS